MVRVPVRFVVSVAASRGSHLSTRDASGAGTNVIRDFTPPSRGTDRESPSPCTYRVQEEVRRVETSTGAQ